MAHDGKHLITEKTLITKTGFEHVVCATSQLYLPFIGEPFSAIIEGIVSATE